MTVNRTMRIDEERWQAWAAAAAAEGLDRTEWVRRRLDEAVIARKTERELVAERIAARDEERAKIKPSAPYVDWSANRCAEHGYIGCLICKPFAPDLK